MIDNTIVNNIRAEIAEKAAASDIFGAVYAYPKATLAKYPAVVVMPSDNEADYGSQSNDKLTFGFTLAVYFPLKKEADYEKAELAIGEAVGELLKIFSVKGVLETCLWVEPVPSVWGVIDGDTPYRYAQVSLKCVTYPLTG